MSWALSNVRHHSTTAAGSSQSPFPIPFPKPARRGDATPTARWLLKASVKTCCFCAAFKPQNFAINDDFKMHQFLPPAVRVCGLAWSRRGVCSGGGSWGTLSVTVCWCFVASLRKSSTRSVLGEKPPSFVQPHQLLSIISICFSGGSSRISLSGTIQHSSALPQTLSLEIAKKRDSPLCHLSGNPDVQRVRVISCAFLFR